MVPRCCSPPPPLQANEKFQTKARSVNERFAMLLKTGTFGAVADANTLAERAPVMHTEVQETLAKFSGGLSMVYRYFALVEDLKEEKTSDDKKVLGDRRSLHIRGSGTSPHLRSSPPPACPETPETPECWVVTPAAG